MFKLALLGRNISHSQSPSIYRKLLGEKLDYKLFDYKNEDEIPSLENEIVKIDQDSILVCYTDGLVEIENVSLKRDG